jgi:hypothetical protein
MGLWLDMDNVRSGKAFIPRDDRFDIQMILFDLTGAFSAEYSQDRKSLINEKKRGCPEASSQFKSRLSPPKNIQASAKGGDWKGMGLSNLMDNFAWALCAFF